MTVLGRCSTVGLWVMLALTDPVLVCSLSTFFGGSPLNVPRHAAHNNLVMRDQSAATWYQVGDRVQVVDDVYKSQQNLKGLQGRVIETWEKCDVDPTCCCAEQVDENMAVRVKFDEANLEHYFGEEELQKIADE